jgi:hypothetical protein
MGKQTGQQIDLVAAFTSYRNVILMAMGFEFGKNTFLRSPAFMIGCHTFGADRLIGHNHFEVIAIVIRNKQVQLDRIFAVF